MDSDKRLEQVVGEYQAVAKENKDVDVAALMLNALQMEDRNHVSAKAKRWAYLISIGAPPLGLIFMAKYYFSDEADARQVANTCGILTVVGIASFFILARLLVSGSGVSVDQIQQIKPQDVKELYAP